MTLARGTTFKEFVMKPSPALMKDLEKFIGRCIKKIKKDRKSKFLIDYRKSCPADRYYSEFGSLTIGLPRRNGNTALAIKLLAKYPKSIYIGLTLSVGEDSKTGGRIFKANKLNLLREILFKPEIVITDCKRFFREKDVREMYDRLDRFHPVYIHLG